MNQVNQEVRGGERRLEEMGGGEPGEEGKGGGRRSEEVGGGEPAEPGREPTFPLGAVVGLLAVL